MLNKLHLGDVRANRGTFFVGVVEIMLEPPAESALRHSNTILLLDQVLQVADEDVALVLVYELPNALELCCLVRVENRFLVLDDYLSFMFLPQLEPVLRRSFRDFGELASCLELVAILFNHLLNVLDFLLHLLFSFGLLQLLGYLII